MGPVHAGFKEDCSETHLYLDSLEAGNMLFFLFLKEPYLLDFIQLSMRNLGMEGGGHPKGKSLGFLLAIVGR